MGYRPKLFLPCSHCNTAPITAAINTIPIIMQEEGRVAVVGLNVIACFTFAPLTVIFTEEGDVEYPGTDHIVYEYVPFGTKNVFVSVVELYIAPSKVTDQNIPDGRHDSVNVTAYILIT